MWLGILSSEVAVLGVGASAKKGASCWVDILPRGACGPGGQVAQGGIWPGGHVARGGKWPRGASGQGGMWPRGASGPRGHLARETCGRGGKWPGGQVARETSGPGGRMDVSLGDMKPSFVRFFKAWMI